MIERQVVLIPVELLVQCKVAKTLATITDYKCQLLAMWLPLVVKEKPLLFLPINRRVVVDQTTAPFRWKIQITKYQARHLFGLLAELKLDLET